MNNYQELARRVLDSYKLKLMDVKETFDRLHRPHCNFKGLHQFIIDCEVPFEFVNFRIEAMGMAAFDKVYINKYLPFNIKNDILFMVIGHEVGHYLSFRKHGLQHHLDKLSSPDWEVFFEHVIHEEIFADKFAMLLFYKLNGRIYSDFRQNLHLTENHPQYSERLRDNLFKKYTNSIEDYQRIVESLIVK